MIEHDSWTRDGRRRREPGGRVIGAVRRGACLLLVAVALTSSPRAEIIDRILAIVGGELIMLSDATAAIRFGLVEIPADSPDRTRAALAALIDRHLQLVEVNRYLPPEPAPAAIDERMAAIRSRLGTEEAFAAALAESGLTETQLRARVRDNLRITAYRAQRFAGALQPSEEDLVRYYRSRESEFTKDGVPQPFEAVRDQVRARLASERTELLVRDWLETLRRRAEMQVLYSPPR